MKYLIVMKHTTATPRAVHKCKKWREFSSFYILPGQERKEHGAQRGSKVQNVDITQVMGDVDNNNLREELQMCKPFLLVTELENVSHRVSTFAMDILDSKFNLKYWMLCLTVSNWQLSWL